MTVLEDYRKELEQEAMWGILPVHMRAGMRLYIESGIEPGSFLAAVLCNDLREAIGRADHINRDRIPDYVQFLYNRAPSACWGSPAKYLKWVSHGGLSGLKLADSAEESKT